MIDINMKQQEDKQYQPQVSKRTRKTKLVVPSYGTRTTRRARRKDSEQEMSLPENVPCDQFEDLQIKQFFEEETTKVVIQIRKSWFDQEEFSCMVTTRAETLSLQIQIVYSQLSIACNIRVHQDMPLEEEEDHTVNVHGKCSWLFENRVSNKALKVMRKKVSREWEEFGWIKLEKVHSDFFINLTLRKEDEIWDEEGNVGLVNQGNTCYMNSYLQMLFHLPQFRKLIFSAQTKQTDRFPATLQMLFFRMLTEQRSASPEELIRSFGWTKKDAQVQQDVQQFSCLFFEILQQKVMVLDKLGYTSSVNELFCGELTHYIQCCNVGTNHERFFDIHLAVTPSLDLSLDIYIQEQELKDDNKYHAGMYGLQDAKKGLRISKLPPVLMCQLKRFQFNFHTESNEKIMGQCKYPDKIDFSKWTTNPQKPKPYELYAVLVHEGSHANSGHYYVFIKCKNQWIKFNDERVEKATKDKALRYNYGGESDTVDFNAKQMKLKFKKHQNKATAYMLVYVSKPLSGSLFSGEDKYPQWLLDKTQERKVMEEEKKMKKQSICNVPVLKWADFKWKTARTGFLSRELIEDQEEMIELIPKGAKVDEWLKQLKRDEEDKEVYVYWTVQDREVLINACCRGSLSVKDLFTDASDPVLVLLPTPADKEEYLIILKQFQLQEDEEENGQLVFIGLSTIKKDEDLKGLHKTLSVLYHGETTNNYYIEDKKQGLIKICEKSTTLLPASSPTRNQLLVVVVQRLKTKQKKVLFEDWYKEEMDTIKVQIFSEDCRDSWWDKELNKHQSIQEIRRIVFAECVQDKEEDYQSPDNVVIKYRAKKNSKLLTEATEEQTVKDLIKIQKCIYFSYSQLDTKQRLTRKELNFYIRINNSLILSDVQKIVVQKNNQSSIVDFIFASQIIKEIIPSKMGYGLRMFLLSKDKSYINDIVDQKGYVPKKGELLQVMSREKYSSLVVEQYQTIESEEGLMNVLVHHVAKTGEKIGMPRWQYVMGGALLTKLKYYLLEKIEKDEIQFEGKVHQLNPTKVRLLAYVKEWGRAEDLPDEFEIMNGDEKEEELTVEGKYGKPKYLRVGVVHSQISKSQKALKLNVE